MLPLWIIIAVLHGSYVSARTPTTADKAMITPAPEVRKRDSSDWFLYPEFIGYYTPQPGAIWTASLCGGSQEFDGFYSTGLYTYGGCSISDTTIAYFTDCQGSLMYGTGSVFTTPYQFTSTCSYGCVFDYIVDVSAETTNFVNCGGPRTTHRTLFYMESTDLPSISTSSISSVSSVGTTPIPSKSSSVTLPSSTSRSSSTSTTTPTPPPTHTITPNPNPPKTAVGPIIGGAIGGIAGIALIVTGIFLLVRRQRRANTGNGQPFQDQPQVTNPKV